MLPVNLILVRHGQSEGNVAHKASRKGDNRFFSDEFRDRHSRTFHLTDLGIEQAKAAGVWLRANLGFQTGRFYVSDYVRAMETAAYLGLPNARWRREFHLRERDLALMDNMPEDEKKTRFPEEHAAWARNQFLSTPAGGGESVAQLCQRLKTTMLAHWARECPEENIIVVSHGHTMRALQVEIEGLLPEDFNRLDKSKVLAKKIRNCQILWYTRIDPKTGKLRDRVVAVRSVCPHPFADYAWRYLRRRTWTNEQLLIEVAKHPRQIAGC